MSGTMETVEDVLSHGTDLKLPTTAKLQSAGPLDSEEKDGEAGVSFLMRSTPKRRPKKKLPEPAQSGWSTLERALAADDGVRSSIKLPERSLRIAEEENWHEIPVARMTPELEKDLRVIENRQHLDPKRFYKSSGSGRRKGELPTRVQVGTIVVGAHEFYSARLNKRERRATILDEVMSDERIVNYTKTKFKNLQTARQTNKRVVDPAAKKSKKRRMDDW